MVLIFSYFSLEIYIHKHLILINFMLNIPGRNNQLKITDKVKGEDKEQSLCLEINELMHMYSYLLT